MKNKAGDLISYLMIVLAGIILMILLIGITGNSISDALSGFIRGIAGSSYSVAEVFVKATPLILTGLGVSVAFKSGFVNIGAEGQLYMGAVTITALALTFPDLPKGILMPLCLLGGFLAGGVWSLIPGILKAKMGISEVINTIMFNYIALGIVGILLQTVLKDPNNYFPVSATLTDSAGLSVLIPGTRLHSGILIAVICAILIDILIFKTSLGFRLRAVGMNPRACICSGISVGKHIIISSMVSGGLAGIAGVCEIAGLHHKLIEGISPGYGYLAIIVALLGGNNPFGVIMAAIGIATLQVGSLSMQRAANVPSAISSIILGAIVLMLMARKTIFKKLINKKEEQG